MTSLLLPLLSILLVLSITSSTFASKSKQTLPVLTERPIIAIFAHPKDSVGGTELCPQNSTSSNCDYIAASYIKFIESAGGRVVPIPYLASNETVTDIFNQVNGVLFPGGGASLNDGGRKVWELAKASNDNGVYFPLWGTCLGFQWMMQLEGGDDVLVAPPFNSENVSLALDMTGEAPTSKLFSNLAPPLFDYLQSKDSPAFNNHHAGVFTDTFHSSELLSNFYTLLSSSTDLDNQDFVSTVESKDYPFYATQFHPEKNAFEIGMSDDGTPYEDVIHTEEAVDITIYFARLFVNDARLNDHKFDDPAVEQRSLIYNYPIFYTEAYYSESTTPCGFVTEYIDVFSFPGPEPDRVEE
jgi:gamma-glutamyl hydrolase